MISNLQNFVFVFLVSSLKRLFHQYLKEKNNGMLVSEITINAKKKNQFIKEIKDNRKRENLK